MFSGIILQFEYNDLMARSLQIQMRLNDGECSQELLDQIIKLKKDTDAFAKKVDDEYKTLLKTN